MEELYGPITAFLVSAVVAGLAQLAKEYWQLQGKPALLVSLGIALVLFVPFNLIWSDIITARTVYASLIYGFLGFLTSAGLYSTTRTIFKG